MIKYSREYLENGLLNKKCDENNFLIEKVYGKVNIEGEKYQKKELLERYQQYKAAEGGTVDMDVSIFAIISYISYPVYRDFKIERQSTHKYQLVSNDDIIRGDTMINLREIVLKLYGLNLLDEKITQNKDWKQNEELIKECLNLCYAVGNFFPIPYKPRKSLNSAKWSGCQEKIKIQDKEITIFDSFYMFLVHIYNCFSIINGNSNDKELVDNNAYSKLLLTNYRDWFKKFDNSWDKFVEFNYLGMFVDKNNKPKKFLEDNMALDDCLNEIIKLLSLRRDVLQKELKNYDYKALLESKGILYQ